MERANASAVVVNVVGITATPTNQARDPGDSITPAHCGTGVEFRRTLDGVAGSWQDSLAFNVGAAFGVWKIRVRSKDDTSKLHHSGEFTVTEA